MEPSPYDDNKSETKSCICCRCLFVCPRERDNSFQHSDDNRWCKNWNAENISTTYLSSSSTPKFYWKEKEKRPHHWTVRRKVSAQRATRTERNVRIRTYLFLIVGHVYSCSPVCIDSALLFTCLKKKQMALTYLMLGVGKVAAGSWYFSFVCVSFAGVWYFICPRPFLPVSPPLLLLSGFISACSQPRCRQEVRPRHSVLPAVSAGSPCQITPPTVQYLKKSSILFVWDSTIVCVLSTSPDKSYTLCKTAEQVKGGKLQIKARFKAVEQWLCCLVGFFFYEVR